MSTDQQPLALPKFFQVPELSQEDRELIASLPTEKVWIGLHLHQYQGFWYITRHLAGILVAQRHFQARETDIFLATTPKAGTTWLKAIIFALISRGCFTDTEHPLLTNNSHHLVPFLELEHIEKPFPDFNGLRTPRFFATHLSTASLPKSVEESGCKIVYLCRNPKDIFVSYWHFFSELTKELGEHSLEENFDQFCRGESLNGPFWDHVLGYWSKSKESPQRVFFLKYEDLKREPKTYLKRLSEFLGCEFSQKEEESGVIEQIIEICDFDYLSNLEVNKSGKTPRGLPYKHYFRRGHVGDATNHLTAEMVERMDRITEQKLYDSGLDFD